MIHKGDDAAGAIFSDCDAYRYQLWRQWRPRKPVLVFCMLNPSTATHEISDATITRCVERAKMMDYGELRVVNIFALRATDPKKLYAADDPVGPDNDFYIREAARLTGVSGGMMVLGWGQHGGYLSRGDKVFKALRAEQIRPFVLDVTKNGGHPKHPLYISYEKQPIPYEGRP